MGTLPWTLRDAWFVSHDEPLGLNVGRTMVDYTDGDSYVTTSTFTVAKGTCYAALTYGDIMYMGCSTSEEPYGSPLGP